MLLCLLVLYPLLCVKANVFWSLDEATQLSSVTSLELLQWKENTIVCILLCVYYSLLYSIIHWCICLISYYTVVESTWARIPKIISTAAWQYMLTVVLLLCYGRPTMGSNYDCHVYLGVSLVYISVYLSVLLFSLFLFYPLLLTLDLIFTLWITTQPEHLAWMKEERKVCFHSLFILVMCVAIVVMIVWFSKPGYYQWHLAVCCLFLFNLVG